jgi:hypothetical protein
VNLPPAASAVPTSQGPSSAPQSIAHDVGIQPGDPARDRVSRVIDMCRNLDLPPEAYRLDDMVSVYLISGLEIYDKPLL